MRLLVHVSQWRAKIRDEDVLESSGWERSIFLYELRTVKLTSALWLLHFAVIPVETSRSFTTSVEMLRTRLRHTIPFSLSPR